MGHFCRNSIFRGKGEGNAVVCKPSGTKGIVFLFSSGTSGSLIYIFHSSWFIGIRNQACVCQTLEFCFADFMWRLWCRRNYLSQKYARSDNVRKGLSIVFVAAKSSYLLNIWMKYTFSWAFPIMCFFHSKTYENQLGKLVVKWRELETHRRSERFIMRIWSWSSSERFDGRSIDT